MSLLRKLCGNYLLYSSKSSGYTFWAKVILTIEPEEEVRMMDLKEQVAYLRGLIEGQEFPGEKEGIFWQQLLNVCDLVTLEIDEMRKEHEELYEYVEAIDEDLGYLEEQYYPMEEIEEDEEGLNNESYSEV